MDLSFSLDDIRELDGALCFKEGHDPALWHPEELVGSGSSRAGAIGRTLAEQEAKEICARCPVRIRCLDQALRNDDRFGIYGGLTPAERAAIKDGAA